MSRPVLGTSRSSTPVGTTTPVDTAVVSESQSDNITEDDHWPHIICM
ncbi:uncharacterized protein METZ01_LOCUS303241 [marine metagenome]|uniref:Uncharacterized protein n=1 Tax=marine metagenome TaxID=408172 RepID=A0A382MRI9_9ZZZZ